MENTKFRVESGIQLLTRLRTKKTKGESFYPNLLHPGPNSGEIIEIFSNRSTSFLLIDVICEALLPLKCGGTEIGVLILNTDGHITLQGVSMALQNKLNSRYNFSSNGEDYAKVLKGMLNNLYILDIFDSTQLYNTILNLENVLRKHSNISLCVIDTFTAFYWSEQSYKINKMDVYLKNLLHILQKAVQGHELTIIYTRPEYFNSSKDLIENLEPCVESPTIERVNCRVQLIPNEDETFTTNVVTHSSIVRRNFKVENNEIVWL